MHLASPLCYSQRPHSIYLSTCFPPCKPGCGGLAAVLFLWTCSCLCCFLGGEFADPGLLLSDISQQPLGHQQCSGIFSQLPHPLDALGGVWACGEHCCQRGTHPLMLSPKVNVGDTIAMLPKSRRALTIQEIAALARSSLHGMHPFCPFAHALGDCIL